VLNIDFWRVFMANDIGKEKKRYKTQLNDLKQHNNWSGKTFEKVFEEVFLYLIQLSCQLTYFNRQVNWIKFTRTSSELDVQHNDERQNVSRGLFWVRSPCLANWHVHIVKAARSSSWQSPGVHIFRKIFQSFLLCFTANELSTLIYRSLCAS